MIGFHLDVAGVAIATIISQCVSCILVLRCLCRTQGSYQLHFSKLSINGAYLKQIFQVGIPAGIQSTVINFSNALLQSSVNSFGATAMAGYTAANNLLGFLYVSVNSITQACMSFTSQNFSVGKYKRMDRVLMDCLILSVSVAAVLGCSAYFFGAQILTIYTKEPDVIACGLEILPSQPAVFPVRHHGSFPRRLRGMGVFLCSHDIVCNRHGRDAYFMDLCIFPASQIPVFSVYLVSGVLAGYDHNAGDLLLLCAEKCLSGCEESRFGKNTSVTGVI